jgi:hypothetical protein
MVIDEKEVEDSEHQEQNAGNIEKVQDIRWTSRPKGTLVKALEMSR